MKILVACEFSGIVREAFAERGHEVYSCDFLPSEQPGLHLQRNVLEILEHGWDMMLAFPPCTYLALSGMRWNVDNPERQQKTADAIDFVQVLLSAPIPKIVLENPVGVIPRHTGIRWTQKIHPWQFGHGEKKTTCLWLKGLPVLIPTKIVEGREARVHKEPPSSNRWKNRSRTLPGIAQAMSDQWGG